MWTRLMPPGRADTLVRRARHAALWLGFGTCWAAPESAGPTLSGPWLLGALALALAVVAGLATALGYAWGRREVLKSWPAGQTLAGNRDTQRLPAAGEAAQAEATAAALGTTANTAHPAYPEASVEHIVPAKGHGDPSSSAAPLPHQATRAKATPPPANTAQVPTSDEGLSFSYTVSHDLRAPVRVVDGFARILKEDYSRQLDRIGNDHLDRILSAAARMNAMIDAMLSLAQLSTRPLARQPVNLSQLATYILEDLRRGQPEREVAVQIEPELHVTGDPTLLRLVLENLLSNAWKYTGKTASPSIELRAVQADGQRVFEVRDNGAGFDMRSSDRLFGLFQRLHSANDFPGTGVGLASVQRIVRRHGGDIWAQSSPGQGARFCFTIKS
jgi:two-component sensor histidine kinase